MYWSLLADTQKCIAFSPTTKKFPDLQQDDMHFSTKAQKPINSDIPNFKSESKCPYRHKNVQLVIGNFWPLT